MTTKKRLHNLKKITHTHNIKMNSSKMSNPNQCLHIRNLEKSD
jgi:hypothetical protein